MRFSHTGNRSSMPCSLSTELDEAELTKHPCVEVTGDSHRGRSVAQKHKLYSLNTFGYFILDISLLIITLCFKNSKYVYGNFDISVALDAKFGHRASQAGSNVRRHSVRGGASD